MGWPKHPTLNIEVLMPRRHYTALALWLPVGAGRHDLATRRRPSPLRAIEHNHQLTPQPIVDVTSPEERVARLPYLKRRVFRTTMPADIRSFFGGGPRSSQGSQGSQKQDGTASKKTSLKKTGRTSRVIDDSEDDDEDIAK